MTNYSDLIFIVLAIIVILSVMIILFIKINNELLEHNDTTTTKSDKVRNKSDAADTSLG